jgi:hypothetical protein
MRRGGTDRGVRHRLGLPAQAGGWSGEKAQRRSNDENRQIEARLRAEGASATARLSVVERPEWWNHASPQQIVAMYALAHQWRDHQSHAATAPDTLFSSCGAATGST